MIPIRDGFMNFIEHKGEQRDNNFLVRSKNPEASKRKRANIKVRMLLMLRLSFLL